MFDDKYIHYYQGQLIIRIFFKLIFAECCLKVSVSMEIQLYMIRNHFTLVKLLFTTVVIWKDVCQIVDYVCSTVGLKSSAVDTHPYLIEMQMTEMIEVILFFIVLFLVISFIILPTNALFFISEAFGTGRI